ncbi:MAG: DUF4345 domain-containing protein [Bacteroidota bacterium]
MKNRKVLKIYLIIAGLLLTLIGGATLFLPVDIKAAAGIDLAGNASLLNDFRASAAMILAFGILIFSGALVKSIRFTAVLLSAVVFLSLGLGRLLSILLDGMPVQDMVMATGLEFVLGITGAILFLAHKNSNAGKNDASNYSFH